MNRMAVVIAACAVILEGCCGSCSGVDIDDRVPIYPGAKKAAGTETMGITNVTYKTRDSGEDVKAWYTEKLEEQWERDSAAEWTVRKKMAGMKFEYSYYDSRSQDDHLRVEVAWDPDKPEKTVIRLRHCPAGKKVRCMAQQ